MKATDLTGQRFGRLLVLTRNGSHVSPSGQSKAVWTCSCDCGAVTDVIGAKLRNGQTTSCGCRKKEFIGSVNFKHGHARSNQVRTEHRIWYAMVRRCTDEKDAAFPDYGGRGISVCQEWLDYETFFSDMGKRPSHLHTLDRKDNNGNYEPSNCRWATKKEQANNRRSTVFVDYQGKSISLTELAELTGINRATLGWRVRQGWTGDRLFIPARM